MELDMMSQQCLFLQLFDMNHNESFDVVEKAIPGVIGAAGALLWIHAPWPRKLAMFALGATLAYVAADYVAAQFSLPHGLSGFLLGLFGMSIVDAVFKAPWTAIVIDILKTRFGGSKE